MDAGGFPLPQRGRVNVIGMMASMCVVGRDALGPSSPTLVNPTNGRICPGPTSMGALLGNDIIPPAGSSDAMWLHHHHFHNEQLRDVSSAISESVADSHSWNL